MANNKVGRKRFEDEAMKRTNVSLNEGRKDALKKVGNGNISEGIRILVDCYKSSAAVRACVKLHGKNNNKA